MSCLYKIFTSAANGAMHAVNSLPGGHSKARRGIAGQLDAIQYAADHFQPAGENYWFHCSSLGEYAIARPLMEEIHRRRPEAKIALTFFSPTGVEALSRRKNVPADFIGYLPTDTSSHAARFLDIVRPSAGMFMVSEYWPGYLEELRRRRIPTYLVSALFTRRAPHYNALIGSTFRRSLRAYTHVFALDDASVLRLAALGMPRASISGDPLMDNALKVAATDWHNAALERFCSKERTLIAGSLTDYNDLRLIAAQVNFHPERRYVLVPHEVDEAHLAELEKQLHVPFRRLSTVRDDEDISENVLIVDSIGQLAYLYRLGTMAYIGGGFTSQLHSLIEATVYGLPVAFGPRTERKVTPAQLEELGVATKVHDTQQFTEWCEAMFKAPQAELDAVGRKCAAYCQAQAGATRQIVDKILGES